MHSPVKMRSRFLRMLIVGRGTGVVFRDGPLLLRQDVHPETLPGVQMRVSPRPPIHAYQHEGRVQRHRSEGVGRHAMDFVILVDGDHRDSSRKTTQRSAEFGLRNAHGKRGAALRVYPICLTPEAALSPWARTSERNM